MQTDLSVIIPVYNAEKYLKRCLDSVLKSIENSNDKNIQIIIINDGSNDNCDKIIKTYLEIYKNIDYIVQDNKGIGATRNIGIEKSKGEYISFVDSDDEIDINFFKSLLDKILIEQSDIVVCDCQTVEGNRKYVYSARNKNIDMILFSIFDISIVASPWNKIYKKSLFNNLKFPEVYGYEDLATIPCTLLKSSKISYVNKPYYNYYINSDSIMHSKFDKSKLKIIDSLNLLFERIDKLGLEKKIEDKIKYMIFFRRYYEDILEKIVLNKENKSENLTYFVDSISDMLSNMKNNIFFMNNIKRSSKIKQIFNKILIYAVTKKKIRLLKVLLYNKKLFYRCIMVKYDSKTEF